MRDGLPMRVVPNPTSPPEGSASISGSIVSTSGQPLPARVVLYSENPRLVPDRATNSNAQGRYQFTGLPAGTYRMAAARPGYSMSPEKYPQYSLASMGVPATVGA